MARRVCEVVTDDRGRFTLHPCGTLSSVLVPDIARAGAQLERVGGGDFTLVIRPTFSQGPGKVANFCPYCGTPLHAWAGVDSDQRPTPLWPMSLSEVAG